MTAVPVTDTARLVEQAKECLMILVGHAQQNAVPATVIELIDALTVALVAAETRLWQTEEALRVAVDALETITRIGETRDVIVAKDALAALSSSAVSPTDEGTRR